jgi:hypothetical protein
MFLVVALIGSLAVPAAVPTTTAVQPESTTATKASVPGFTWEFQVHDLIKHKTETYRLAEERTWSFGAFSCRAEPQTARREDTWVIQDLSLTCEAGSVITVTGATCAFTPVGAPGRRMASSGKVHLSLAVTNDQGGAVLFESQCLEPKP